MIAPTIKTSQTFDPAQFTRVRWLIYAILATALTQERQWDHRTPVRC